MNQQDFVLELSKLRPSSTFLSLKGYKNEYGEIADYNIVFHISYENALKRSIMALEVIVPSNDLEARAKFELLESYKSSLNKISESSIEEIDSAYTWFINDNGSYIKGVKMHNETGALYLYGMLNSKRLIVPGVYPKRNRRELTIAKDNLRRVCAVDKFRQFKILPNQVERICVENLSLLPPV